MCYNRDIEGGDLVLEKHIDTANDIMQGLIFVVLGIVLLLSKSAFIYTMIQLSAVMLLILGAVNFLDWFFHMQRKTLAVNAVGFILLGLWLLFYPQLAAALFPIIYGLVVAIYGFSHMITCIIFFKSKNADWVTELIITLVYFILMFLLLFQPLIHLDAFMFFVGGYFVLFGLNHIRIAIKEILRLKDRLGKKRHFRVQLPVILASILPHAMLVKVNRYIQEHSEMNQNVIADLKEDTPPDLEVLVHVTDKGFGAMGHVDLVYNGFVISYGNYDATSWKLHEMVGRGILFIAPKEAYIPFAIEDSKKTLFGFGLRLTDKQKERVDMRLREIMDNTLDFETDYERACQSEDEELKVSSQKYYANRLVKNTGAKLYHFKKGYFKIYFVMVTNCVALADSIIGKTGIDIVGNIGIITPGTYYDYFNRQFLRRDTNVISRTIYR